MKSRDGPLSSQELQHAENHWIKESQKILSDRLRKRRIKEAQSLHRF